jgi:hypothetical protein
MRFSTNIRLRPYKLNSANIAEVLAIDCTVTPARLFPAREPPYVSSLSLAYDFTVTLPQATIPCW